MTESTMLLHALKAIIWITTLLGGWMLIHAAWRRTFPGSPAHQDLIAGRLGCHQCPCESRCERLSSNDPHPDHPTSTQSEQ